MTKRLSCQPECMQQIMKLTRRSEIKIKNYKQLDNSNIIKIQSKDDSTEYKYFNLKSIKLVKIS